MSGHPSRHHHHWCKTQLN